MVISLRKGIVGILNFSVAGLILTEVFIYGLKNAQSYSGVESLTQMLLGAIGFSQIGWGIWVFIEYRNEKPKEKQQLTV
jgi:hypothetical protein